MGLVKIRNISNPPQNVRIHLTDELEVGWDLPGHWRTEANRKAAGTKLAGDVRELDEKYLTKGHDSFCEALQRAIDIKLLKIEGKSEKAAEVAGQDGVVGTADDKPKPAAPKPAEAPKPAAKPAEAPKPEGDKK